jgi:phosphopantothenoylcysteine synthetase/decarboxylase
MTPRPLHFLVTAGPTREALDPVRFLSNRSSGKMGFAIARAAAEAGHRVTLIAGPVALATPPGVVRHDVESADDMFRVVAAVVTGASVPVDVAVLSAAVADYRPVVVAAQKIKKHAGRLTLELERTRDILGSMREPLGFCGVLIGFAAETENVLAHAREKCTRKRCDLVVANDVSQPGIGFDADANEVTLVLPGDALRPLPRGSKLTIARELVQVAVSLSQPGPAPGRPSGGSAVPVCETPSGTPSSISSGPAPPAPPSVPPAPTSKTTPHP